jgi:8-oxo-dGTP pyrophosphatase MutT (NUDIX family)
VRALILDPADRVLMVRFEDELGTWWSTPGGGVDPGESDEEALARELAEEVGLRGFAVGPHIWTREHWLVNPQKWGGQRERHYLVRTDAFEPAPAFSVEELAAEGVQGAAWFTVDELDTVITGPRRLTVHVRELLAHGPPSKPIDVSL